MFEEDDSGTAAPQTVPSRYAASCAECGISMGFIANYCAKCAPQEPNAIADANAAITKLQRIIERARYAADMGHLLTVQKILEGRE